MHNPLKSIQILIEKTYVKTLRLKHIPRSSVNLLYADIKTYKGQPIDLNGTTISKGDKVIEFHIDNLNVGNIDGSIKSVIRNFNTEMQSLSEAIASDELFKDVKGAYAVTVLHPLLKLIGFTSFPLKNKLYANYLRFWENQLRTSFGAGKNKSKKKRDPMTCWISSETITSQGLKAAS